MVKIIWTPLCLDDIENIAKYIAKDSLKYAEIQVEVFFESVLILEKFPNTGRVVPEYRKANVRELIVGFYRIIYRIKDGENIEILTIHHTSMLLKRKTIKRRL